MVLSENTLKALVDRIHQEIVPACHTTCDPVRSEQATSIDNEALVISLFIRDFLFLLSLEAIILGAFPEATLDLR